MNLKERVFALTKAVGTSGLEKNASELACDMLKEFCPDAHIDNMGNVIGSFGEGEENILVEAHIDQIGLIVTAIEDGGFIKVTNCGGVDKRLLAAQEVTVWGKEKLIGVVSSTPPHLSGKDDDSKAIAIDDVAIDMGMSAEILKEKVSLGDRVTINSKQLEL
ncbi:MAG: M42 family peptidase, partial [Clostridiales bacterium]|nr:M42 family peptidase [Clostridiales bacterium]